MAIWPCFLHATGWGKVLLIALIPLTVQERPSCWHNNNCWSPHFLLRRFDDQMVLEEFGYHLRNTRQADGMLVLTGKPLGNVIVKDLMHWPQIFIQSHIFCWAQKKILLLNADWMNLIFSEGMLHQELREREPFFSKMAQIHSNIYTDAAPGCQLLSNSTFWLSWSTPKSVLHYISVEAIIPILHFLAVVLFSLRPPTASHLMEKLHFSEESFVLLRCCWFLHLLIFLSFEVLVVVI